MESVLIGYFPKKCAVPEGFGTPHLKDLSSVSTCIAEGPPGDWINLWLHNNYGLFPTVEHAARTLQGVDDSEYSIHAYRLFPIEFDEGAGNVAPLAEPQVLFQPNNVSLECLPHGYRSLGFDVVEFPQECSSFGCSPLSCNGGWKEFETNEHCLVSSLPRAMDVAAIVSRGGWEPGPYRIVEVFGAGN